jgi:carbon-monoxide dehydrogenase small subunit
MKTATIRMKVNGDWRRAEVRSGDTLLEALRGRLGVHSPKEGCGRGDCGACTVLLDGRAVRSCLVLAVEADGRAVTTVEGVGGGKMHAVQEECIARNVFQCGFCAPGMILAAAALLAKNPAPTAKEVREALAGNLCRCTGYEPIVEAVLAAAKRMGAENAK